MPHDKMLDVPQDKPARGSGSLPPHAELPEERCFDLSCLIAASIKIFFRNIMWAGHRCERLCLVLGCASPAVLLMQRELEKVRLWGADARRA